MTGDEVETARITITRHLSETGDLVFTEATTPDGEDLPLVEALGLLAIASDTCIRQAMGEVPDDEEDQ